MTYNIHHGAGTARPSQVSGTELPPHEPALAPLWRAARVMQAFAPDVVGLQEVDRFWARSGCVDQGLLLAGMLGMTHCYGPNLDHPPDDHSPVAHQYGTAILSRYPLGRCMNRRLPRISSTSEERGLLSAAVALPGVEIPVFNTHLQHDGPLLGGSSESGRPDRAVQVQAICDLIGTRDVAILMGDFNASPDWPELCPLRESFEDAWTSAGSGGPGMTYPAGVDADPRRRIDHIFFRGLRALATRVPLTSESRTASDHYPVMLEATILE
jgi:endonuclease/exonuclease/phosphatase family metal-dependent hydrolase